MPRTEREIARELFTADLRFSDLSGNSKIGILEDLPDCKPRRMGKILTRPTVVLLLSALLMVLANKQHFSPAFAFTVVVLWVASTVLLTLAVRAIHWADLKFANMVETARKEANEQAAQEEEKASEDVVTWEDLVQRYAEGRSPTRSVEPFVNYLWETPFEGVGRTGRDWLTELLAIRRKELAEKLIKEKQAQQKRREKEEHG